MAFLYILQQISSALVLLRMRTIYGLISLCLFITILVLKEDTYDLISYVVIFQSNAAGYDSEAAFSGLVRFFNRMIDGERGALYLYQAFLIALVSSVALFYKRDRILIVAISLSSVAAMLTINNNLRQGAASIFIFLSLLAFFKRKKMLAILLAITAVGFHMSAPLFLVLVIGIGVIYRALYIERYEKSHYGIIRLYLIGLSISIGLALTFHIIVEYLPFSHYVGKILTEDSERTGLFLKIVAVFGLLVASESVLKFRSVDYELDFFRLLRLTFLSFLLVISIVPQYDEIGSRILFFYFVIEMGLLSLLVSRRLFNTVVMIVFGYAFASNVWNILGGF